LAHGCYDLNKKRPITNDLYSGVHEGN